MPNPVTSTDPTESPTGSRARIVLLIGSLGFFLITLDILIVNVALPAIGREFHATTSGEQWVIDGYTLMFASLLLFAGNLSDRIGAKKALGWGIAGFLIASIACAAAPTLGALIAARVVQGSAAAIMLPASMSLIREAYPDARKRAHALGIWAVGGAVAGAVGPLVGGALTTINWRLVFAINLPACILMLVLLVSVTTSPTRPSPFDWFGQVTAIVGLAGLVFGLIEGGSRGFASPIVIVSLVVSALSITGFILIQARGAYPMMPLQLFRPRGMRIALLIGFAFMVGNFGTVFVNSLYLQIHLGLTPLLAGLVFLPSAAFSITGNVISGTLANRFGARTPIVFGLSLMVIGLVGLIVTAPLGIPAFVAVFMVFTGGGGSVAMPPVASVVLSNAPAAQAGTASAIFNTFRQVGGAVAIAAFGILIADRTTFVTGVQISFIIAATLIAAAAIASTFLRDAHAPEHPVVARPGR